MFIFLCRFAPGELTLRSAGLKKEKKAPGEKLPALTPVPDGVEFGQTHEPVNTNSSQADSSSIEAVSFSPAGATKRFPSSFVKASFLPRPILALD
jgi:hypothetical protein